MKRALSCVLVLGFVLVANSAFAQSAFQLGLPNLNLPDSSSVSGLRLSILHGKNRSQSGLDLGLIGMSETSTLSGLALVAGISRVTGNADGAAAFSLINWHSGRDSGANGAFINILNDASEAFDLGFVTIAQGRTAFDLGGFNMSRSSTVQIGFLNVTDRIESFQFGFLNIAKNGFLPVFPVVNFPK